MGLPFSAKSDFQKAPRRIALRALTVRVLGGGGVGEETLLQKGPSPTKFSPIKLLQRRSGSYTEGRPFSVVQAFSELGLPASHSTPCIRRMGTSSRALYRWQNFMAV